MLVEPILDPDRPNPLPRLRCALKTHGLPPIWVEWDRQAPACPDQLPRYGSPTVLVNRRDVACEPPIDTPSSRFYFDDRGDRHGAPSIEIILVVLEYPPEMFTTSVEKNDRRPGRFHI
ncbi:MAG: hypothetical protein AMJ84_01725 [Acidithiobacillales bacterium SM23_46]|jgi:hypothetical protein|nr:MAG: hypothetical protein AMJ84_01725 [Acidithiobacillales bacterium SM23_46]